jgi:glucuronate isomerase
MTPSDTLQDRLLAEMERWPIVDVHSHIDAHSPAARDWDEILAYHYYTELAHSAGMPAAHAAPDLPRGTRLRNLATWLPALDNTVQHGWLAAIAREFHGFDGPIDASTVEELTRRADHHQDAHAWHESVWARSNLEAVFLTNEFDDPLEGFDTGRFVPCLRTDELVFRLHEPRVVERLRHASDLEVHDLNSLRMAIAAIFAHFAGRGARACAISLPPDFRPRPATPLRAVTPIRRALHGLPLRDDEREEVRTTVFWMLAEFCAEFALPFDLMIGVHRNVYPAGVPGGRDLFDRRASLHDYAALFRHFPGVTFPVSMLAADAAAELVAYAWIFPNVVPMGHWWYANLPALIEPDLRARLQAVPKTKLLGYYSDAYKLEFILPKFAMYRACLARVLADDVVQARRASEEQALALARHLLLDNPRRVFGLG